MKNIYILKTDKPSRFYYNNNDKQFQLCEIEKKSTALKPNQNIYITSDEKIKEGNWVYDKILNSVFKFESGEANDDYIVKNIKKIILTTDVDLIKDGVQAIPYEFLEWFVKNPSCELVEVQRGFLVMGGWVKSDETAPKNLIKHKIIIPKEEPDYTALLQPVGTKQETLEEAAEIFVKNRFTKQICNDESYPDIYASKAAIVESHILFAKWQQENSNINALDFEIDSLKREIKVLKHQQEQDKNKYSEEDLDAFRKFMIQEQNFSKSCLDVFVKQFKKK